MARRIVLTMLLLVSALLVTAVAPLGLLIAGREQDSFRMETVLSAQTLASAAERGLIDPRPGPVLAAAFVHARAASDEVWVFNADAHLAGRFGGAKRENVPVPPGAITGVLRHSGMMTVTAARRRAAGHLERGWHRERQPARGAGARPPDRRAQ